MAEQQDITEDATQAEDDELLSVNERVASLEQANEEVERLLQQVLDAERKEREDVVAAASVPDGAHEPYRELAVPDVRNMPDDTDGIVVSAQEHVERLHVSTGRTNVRRRDQESKETGFFAKVGAAVMRALRME